jgi:CDP-paratose 2-epimerase
MSKLRTAALNLLRLTGFQAIRAGLQELTHVITALLIMSRSTAPPSWPRRHWRYIGFDGQGHQVSDCLHPRDLARLANVSGGAASATLLQQLSQWCADRWGARTVAHQPEPRTYRLPCSTTWNWQPQIGTTAILEEIATFAEANPNWIALSA